jgi:hypothetical protein
MRGLVALLAILALASSALAQCQNGRCSTARKAKPAACACPYCTCDEPGGKPSKNCARFGCAYCAAKAKPMTVQQSDVDGSDSVGPIRKLFRRVVGRN